MAAPFYALTKEMTQNVGKKLFMAKSPFHSFFKTHIFSFGIAFISFLCYNIEYDYTEWRELHWKNSA